MMSDVLLCLIYCYQRALIQSYLACITYIDDLIGEILGKVDDKSLWSNTIILLTSDHGMLYTKLYFWLVSCPSVSNDRTNQLSNIR